MQNLAQKTRAIWVRPLAGVIDAVCRVSAAAEVRTATYERHTRQGDQRCARRAASDLCPSSFGESESSSFDRERIADAAAAASVTPDRAVSGACAEQQAAYATQASQGDQRCHTTDRAVSGARAEQQAAYATQAFPREREQQL